MHRNKKVLLDLLLNKLQMTEMIQFSVA